jgi:uncharacterized membrane-anchored protein YhcB (DUF1043 family)
MEYMTLAFDLMSIIAIIWTIVQHFQIRSKISQKTVLNQDDLETLQEALDKFETDLKQMRVEHTTSRMELWDYIDQTLKPIKQRLATRATREKEALDQEQTSKKGGIIPFPRTNGAN